VLAGSTSRIAPFVGALNFAPPKNEGDQKPFNLYELIQIIASGISAWGETYNNSPEKILTFIERYDTTISDTRLALINRSASQTE